VLELLAPFPLDHSPLFWSWLQENPSANFDDSGPKDAGELRALIDRRLGAGEQAWEVLADGEPVGAIGYIQCSPSVGGLRGMCFAQRVHGTGVSLRAMRLLLSLAFARGTKTIEAFYFASNARVERFLAKLGFGDIEVISSGSTQQGRLIDWHKASITPMSFKQRIEA
jgi:RimJ/RimL family protein N-acetyltransferase